MKETIDTKTCLTCFRWVMIFNDNCPFCQGSKFNHNIKQNHKNELGHSWLTDWFYRLYHKTGKENGKV